MAWVTGGGRVSSDDERFMRHAFRLARRAAFTSPNPRVGAVVVQDGRVVSSGAHAGAGSPHAEALALRGVDPRGGTLYVNLEPCVHDGRTPPCAPAIIAAGIKRVVGAIEDPDERVGGRGYRLLRGNGVEVTTGVLASEARQLNAAYVHQRLTGLPLVRLKLAMSLDGRMAAPDRSARWITSEATRRRVHARRAAADAVMVGAGTVLQDDPRLTVRGLRVARQPARIVVDGAGRVPPDAAVFDTSPPAGVIVATTDHASHETRVAWKEAGAEVIVLPHAPTGVDLDALVHALAGRGWLEVYCEGGARLATSLLVDDLVDRLELHYGSVLLGRGGPEVGDLGSETIAGAVRWRLLDVTRSDDDVILTLDRRGV